MMSPLAAAGLRLSAWFERRVFSGNRRHRHRGCGQHGESEIRPLRPRSGSTSFGADDGRSGVCEIMR